MQRMHLALMRQAYRAMTSLAVEARGKAGARAVATSSTFALPPSSINEVWLGTLVDILPYDRRRVLCQRARAFL